MPTLTKEMIEAAIQGFESQKQHIDSQVAELRAMLSSNANGSAPDSQPTSDKKRGMSAAGRKAIADAQRKRWAALKGGSVAKKTKRKLSPAGRAAIVAALKRRWAAKKAAGDEEAKPTAKKASRKTAA